jgi:alkylation response protein AidB-like acyl-CoA dehydrogenase
MDFDLTDEQRLLKDSVDRLIADRYEFEARKKYQREPDGWSAQAWAQYAELGLLGLPFTEVQGGFGGGAVEMMIVMEAFGRGLILEPYLATVVLGGGLVRHAASEAQQAALIPEIAAGPLQPRRCRDHGKARWRWLAAGRNEERGAARRLRRPPGRHGAHGRQPARRRRHRTVPGRCA